MSTRTEDATTKQLNMTSKSIPNQPQATKGVTHEPKDDQIAAMRRPTLQRNCRRERQVNTTLKSIFSVCFVVPF